MARRKSMRTEMYRGARILGNLEAAERGPSAYAKRVARRKVYAKTNGATRTLLRSLGL
jgi:hypothetical protein